MITLVTGGSGSGKSEYAEGLILDSSCSRRFYVATMIAYGKREGIKWSATVCSDRERASSPSKSPGMWEG